MLGTFANAQTKFCFVDTEYILKHIPEYKSAQTQLDDLSADWQKEIDTRYAAIEKMYKSYQAEQVLLSDEMKTKREQEIVDKEKQVKEYQKQKFNLLTIILKVEYRLVFLFPACFPSTKTLIPRFPKMIAPFQGRLKYFILLYFSFSPLPLVKI